LLREEAYAACDRGEWAICLQKLDSAKGLDPKSDSDPRVARARNAARSGLAADARPWTVTPIVGSLHSCEYLADATHSLGTGELRIERACARADRACSGAMRACSRADGLARVLCVLVRVPTGLARVLCGLARVRKSHGIDAEDSNIDAEACIIDAQSHVIDQRILRSQRAISLTLN
jgi:hypothetical protein